MGKSGGALSDRQLRGMVDQIKYFSEQRGYMTDADRAKIAELESSHTPSTTYVLHELWPTVQAFQMCAPLRVEYVGMQAKAVYVPFERSDVLACITSLDISTADIAETMWGVIIMEREALRLANG